MQEVIKKIDDEFYFLNKSTKTYFINDSLTTISDILAVLDKYPETIMCSNLNIKMLHNIRNDLIRLDSMIGMQNIKNNILDQIVYYIQEFHKDNNDYMHVAIYGPPGTGKTEIAKIIGNIFTKIGILKKGTFKKVTRSDLIAGFLGQTAIKTRDVIDDSVGGVLFIDEVYSLGNVENNDLFAKECIDTLCEALSEHKDDLMVIIAGYKEEIENCFFSFNQGIKSRFIWQYETETYNAESLQKIFRKKIVDEHWQIKDDDSIPINFFEKNIDKFGYFARDMEALLTKTKVAHSRRVFGKDSSLRKILTFEDLENGFELFCIKEEEAPKSVSLQMMYV